jgi:copper chaperone NosL
MKKARLIASAAALVVAAIVLLGAAASDIQQHPSCKYCGMDREKFSHSRMLVEYEDGTSLGTCSIHCLAVELALAIDKTPRSITVGDMGTKKLIDADKAFWVIGGSKPGVMTKRAKWAFENKKDAEAYIKDNGGALATFDDAIKASYEDMYLDTKMIREKRKAKRQAAVQKPAETKQQVH